MNTQNVEQLCAVLRSYDVNSSRAALMDLDDAVAHASGDEAMRSTLEKELGAILRQSNSSMEAQLYACAKLAMVGGVESVGVLIEQLRDPHLCHAACNALQAMHSPEAFKALLQELKKNPGIQKTQIVRAIAAWGDPGCLDALSNLLDDKDLAMVRAAAQGVGAVGTAKAAKVLAKRLATGRVETKACLADACLACAESLERKGESVASQNLYHAVCQADVPPYIQAAARSRCQASKRA